MSTPKDGGPAFPCERYGDQIGMSLRNYFAGCALQGMCAGESEDFHFSNLYLGLDGKPTERGMQYPLGADGQPDFTKKPVELKMLKSKYQREAEEAYKRADAMLAERARGPQQ